MPQAPFASLSGRLVRRAPPPAWTEPPSRAEHPVTPAAAGWREDLRLFAVTWAAGFVFFLVFLA